VHLRRVFIRTLCFTPQQWVGPPNSVGRIGGLRGDNQKGEDSCWERVSDSSFRRLSSPRAPKEPYHFLVLCGGCEEGGSVITGDGIRMLSKRFLPEKKSSKGGEGARPKDPFALSSKRGRRRSTVIENRTKRRTTNHQEGPTGGNEKPTNNQRETGGGTRGGGGELSK